MNPIKEKLRQELKNRIYIRKMNIKFYKRFNTPKFRHLVKQLKKEKKEQEKLLKALDKKNK